VNDRQILELRGPKTTVVQEHAYATGWEEEPGVSGAQVATAVVFLTNRECPFRCVMCDLWTHTLDVSVDRGAIPAQIRGGLALLPPARQIKLYNAGSFFDPQAIPPQDDEAIAAELEGFERVIVEAHPAFLGGAAGERCLRFRDLLRRPGLAKQPRLEVGIGLETAHEPTLARLNKRMTLDSFRRAADFLVRHDIALRVFVLLNPPFINGDDAVQWACRSIDVAAACGATVCSVIPARPGNGAMEALGAVPPRLRALEAVLEYGLSRRRGLATMRVFADVWDIERFFDCACSPARASRLRAMNRFQRVTARVDCDCAVRSAIG
jgi:radical SAM enzyme (TIGR01210 family)